MRRRFIVVLDIPTGATIRDVKEYLETEITAGVGGLEPTVPMFNLDQGSVRVMDAGPEESELEKEAQ